MLGYWLDRMYLKAMADLQRMANDEEGDTNFISILIILGIVIILAGVFIGFKDQIVGQVKAIVDAFIIK